jgi:hypothetical protein
MGSSIVVGKNGSIRFQCSSLSERRGETGCTHPLPHGILYGGRGWLIAHVDARGGWTGSSPSISRTSCNFAGEKLESAPIQQVTRWHVHAWGDDLRLLICGSDHAER